MQKHALSSLSMTYMEISGVFWPDIYLANISLTRGPYAILPKSTEEMWGGGCLPNAGIKISAGRICLWRSSEVPNTSYRSLRQFSGSLF